MFHNVLEGDRELIAACNRIVDVLRDGGAKAGEFFLPHGCKGRRIRKSLDLANNATFSLDSLVRFLALCDRRATTTGRDAARERHVVCAEDDAQPWRGRCKSEGSANFRDLGKGKNHSFVNQLVCVV